ncbi:hypothetical protein AOQ84DRAFT_261024, partial [Glonium stellatum]
VDNFPLGYPRYSALLSIDPSFFIFRRFSRLRMRLLLLKQVELARLEETLDKVDKEETDRLSLSCLLQDSNPERKWIIETATKRLEEYDKLIDEAERAINRPTSSERDVRSVKNWTKGNPCLARSETAYLNEGDDLASIAGVRDETIFRMESILEDFMPQRLCSGSRRSRRYTADPHVFFFGPRLQQMSRGLIAWMTILTLLVPIAILNSLASLIGRFITIVIAAGVVVFSMSLLTKARTLEVFMAGTAYAAVLVVFTS